MKLSLQKTVDGVYKHFSHDLGFMLLVTGAVGWALSSLAHVTAVVINKDIPKEQKNFLIPQEIADAFVNIAAFIAITHQFNKFGTRMVESGKLTTAPIRNFLIKNQESFKNLNERIIDSNDSISKYFKKVFKNDSAAKQKLEPFFTKRKVNITDSDVFKNNQDNIQKDFYSFYDGVDFISSTVGAIVSCNIVTPILRNIFGAKRQKSLIMHDKLHQSSIMFAKPRVTLESYAQNVSQKTSLTSPNSSMKI